MKRTVILMTFDKLIFYKGEGFIKAESILNGETDYLDEAILLAEKSGYSGNIINLYLSMLIAENENPFSLTAERRTAENNSLFAIAKDDLAEIRKYFDSVLSSTALTRYKCDGRKTDRQYNNLLKLANTLESCSGADAFNKAVCEYYEKHGVGVYAKSNIFRMSNDGEMLAAHDENPVYFENLWGYDVQKKQLCDNTEAFLRGEKANNVLLFGDAGTGKSTSVKALSTKYAENGLRIIEIHKHQFRFLSSLIDSLSTRNYRFIIFMDDLSFEEFEIEYKYLKAVIEGGVAGRPDNVLIYATSNRRHLIKETWSDRSDIKSDDELHHSDTMQEKLSLADRFGVCINFSKPVQGEYFDIVRYLAKLEDIAVDDETLIAEARKWSVRHAGTSGRIAQQFIDYYKAKSSQL